MDIGAWLRGLRLERYEQAFREHDIDAEVLPQLTVEDLTALGIVSIGHRRKILAAIARLPAETDAEPITTYSVEAVSARTDYAERRQLTMMFVDLVGSTALSARLDPEEMREVIRRYQNAVAGEIVRFEGHVAKFMGDGVLAYFGWPKAHEDDVELAVRAGLSVTRIVGQLSVPAHEPLSARVGIARGLVVVGDLIGEGESQEEAVVGGTPNLAARIQEIATPGQVLVSEPTRRLLGANFEFEELPPHRLKGFEIPVPAFAVVGERVVESRFEARSATLPPMVGRDHELALLFERWARAKSGEGQGVLLIGEAGIGKSRISRALLDGIAEECHTRIVYQCSPHHADSALWPAIQQLKRAAGIAEDDATEDKLDKLETLLGPARDAAPLLASMIGLDGSDRYGELELAPQAQRAKTLAALGDQLLRLAAEQPVLMILEDAHWVDPTTLELMEQCLDRSATARILLLLTSRPDHQPELADRPHVTRLTLNRLGRAGAEAIIRRLGGQELPRDTVDTIIARTDGVPLFVEELTKAVVETGDTAIPSSLHDSLLARLDRLPGVKGIAQTASCIGREFEHALLAAIAEQPEPDLQAALTKLAAAELVFRRGTPPEATYAFKHALLRDAAYESLLKSRRREVHRKIYQALARPSAVPWVVPHEQIGQHAFVGELWKEALTHWHTAASRAMERAAFREALAFFERSLEAAAKLPTSSELAVQLVTINQAMSWAHAALREHAPMLDHLAVAERIAADYRLKDMKCELEAQRTHFANHFGGRVVDAITSANNARRLADEVGTPELIAVARFATCQSYWIAGDYRRALEALGEQIEDSFVEVRPAGIATPGNLAVDALAHACSCSGLMGDFAKAEAYGERAREQAEVTQSSYDRVVANYHFCRSLIARGFFRAALNGVETNVRLASEGHYRLLLPWNVAILGLAHANLGNPQEGLAHLHEALAACVELKLSYANVVTFLYLAEAQRIHGISEALSNASQALVLANHHGYDALVVEARRLMAEILLDEDAFDAGQVSSWLDEAEALATRLHLQPELAHCRLARSRLSAGLGDEEQAAAELDDALARYRSMGMQFDEHRTRGTEIGSRSHAPLPGRFHGVA